MSRIVSVIDIGSNSARMAIFERTSRFGFVLIYEVKSKVRISQGSYENNGILQQEPINRAVNAIKDFVAISKQYGSRKLLCVATSAVRDAPNKQEFISLVKKQTKVQVKVIDGVKEAFFGAVACANLLHHKDGITIDIGGGSTECAIIKNGKIIELASLNIGTIRLKELFFDTKSDISNAKAFIKNEIASLPSAFREAFKKEECYIFGIGGTIRALAKVIMKKENYPINSIHGYEFSVKKYISFFKDIYTSEIKKLKTFGIQQDREDNIRGGALILAILLDYFGASKVVASGVGVREGVFLSDLLRNQNYIFPRGINPSYRSLIDRFLPKHNNANIVKKNATNLFRAYALWHNIDEKYLFHLQEAASLVKIGTALSFYASHEHSAYFLLNALDYGYSHIDKAIICLLVRYSNKKIPKNDAIIHLSHFNLDITALQWLSFILSVAESLSLSNKVYEFSFQSNILFIKGEVPHLSKEKLLSLSSPEMLEIEFV